MFSSLSYASNILLHRDGIFHSELGPPRSIIDQENVSQTCPQGILMGTTPQQRKLPKYVNFSTKMNHHNLWYRCPIYDWGRRWHFYPALWKVASFCVYYCPQHNESSLLRSESYANLVPYIFSSDSIYKTLVCKCACFEASWDASS